VPGKGVEVSASVRFWFRLTGDRDPRLSWRFEEFEFYVASSGFTFIHPATETGTLTRRSNFPNPLFSPSELGTVSSFPFTGPLCVREVVG
jgi:hypothetical protein